MNKRLNSVLFILVATIVNIVAMVLIFGVLLVAYARLLAPMLSAEINQILLLVLFIAAIVLTYVLYHQLMKWLSKRYQLEQYFGPLFGRSDKKHG